MILNIYKPRSWTSFDVVKKVRVITGETKVGHGGTLDPFAEGVLIIGTGKDTKALTAITQTAKSYTGVLKLGIGTTTLDPEGEIVEEKPVPVLSEDQIQKMMDRFTGVQDQIPPMFSAKRINGQRLYTLARKKLEVKREPVAIEIVKFDLQKLELPELTFSVTCSKGTYIRVLAADLAQALGTAGHLVRLVRTAIGHYTVDDSMTLEALQAQWTSIAI